MKNEKPEFNLANADKITDERFAEMLDKGVRFIGNLSSYANTNPDRWRNIRALRGKVGESWKEQAGRITEQWHKPAEPLTEEQELARSKYPKAECERLLRAPSVGAKDNASGLSAADYRLLQIAAKSFDTMPDAPSTFRISESAKSHKQPTPPPVPEDKRDLHEVLGMTKTANGWIGSSARWTEFFSRNAKAKK